MNLADDMADTLNVPAKVLINGKTILNAFQSGKLPQEWHEHISNMFLEFKVEEFQFFIEAYKIPIQNMKMIYEETPKFYHTRRMDEFLYGDLGRTASKSYKNY